MLLEGGLGRPLLQAEAGVLPGQSQLPTSPKQGSATPGDLPLGEGGSLYIQPKQNNVRHAEII